MFLLAIFIGIYSYLIFALGLIRALYPSDIFLISAGYFFVILFILRSEFTRVFIQILADSSFQKVKIKLGVLWSDRLFFIIFALVVLQAGVNSIGAFGPELAFDALWYHLTIPKIFLLNHAIFHIPGGVFYYSDMPKLTEMLYVGALSFGNEILAKLIHFGFGILILVSLYFFSRKYFDRTVSILIVAVFYANLVVDWESITAYIDLARTFYEFLALMAIVYWAEKGKKKWFVLSSIMMGFAISVKLLAIGSLVPIFLIIVVVLFLERKSFLSVVAHFLAYLFLTIFVCFPWFVVSFVHTGNPVYPFFSTIYPVSTPESLLSPVRIFSDFSTLFLHADDPISPLYLIFLPSLFVYWKKLPRAIRLISLYSLASLFVWYTTPRTGGGRFILPYLPAFSVLCGACYAYSAGVIRKIMLFGIFFVLVVSIGYRAVANKRYIPVILGTESKDQFLTRNLNFSFGDFYDTNGDIMKIVGKRTVLIYGIHNLYYADFSFVDNSYVRRGEIFSYVLVGNESPLPSRFATWNLVYKNDITQVRLYTSDKPVWTY